MRNNNSLVKFEERLHEAVSSRCDNESELYEKPIPSGNCAAMVEDDVDAFRLLFITISPGTVLYTSIFRLLFPSFIFHFY